MVCLFALAVWFTSGAPYLDALARHSPWQCTEPLLCFFFFKKKKRQPSTQTRSKPREPLDACPLDPRRCNERTSAHKTVFSCCCFSTPHRSPPPSFFASDNLDCSRTKCSFLTTACGCKITAVPPCNSTLRLTCILSCAVRQRMQDQLILPLCLHVCTKFLDKTPRLRWLTLATQSFESLVSW